MTPRLTRLRIAGFKSFAEPVSLDILPGLTGVVGPNGCGKSNVVEALRWAMGETSARSLRGGEMDDVIFAGTTARPSRNLAEVTITLEPGPDGGGLPAPFEAESELQITRRIERGAGSQFRANGRELRARDVQTLYADLASGARSSGMVSQGRVSQLVNAKPEERRQVLEEAAGITGLHARRHEAELKLRAAEQNLLRAEDGRTQLESARDGLRKQARQAARYRNISGLIRAAEAEHLAVLHAQALAGLDAARAALEAARAAAEAAADEVEISGEALAEAEAALPAPRAAEAEARSLLERRRVEAEQLAAEAERVARESAEAEARFLELEADLAAAQRARADAGASVARLAAEAARLGALVEALPKELAAQRLLHAEALEVLGTAQRAADAAAAAANEVLARAQVARAALDAAESRAVSVRVRHAAVQAEHAEAARALISPEPLEDAAKKVTEAETGLSAARKNLDGAESALGDAARTALFVRGQAEQAAAAEAAARRRLDEVLARAAKQEAFCADALRVMRELEGARIDPAALADAANAEAAAEAALAASEAGLEAAERAVSDAGAARAVAERALADVRMATGRAEAALAQAGQRARAIGAEAAQAETAFFRAVETAPAPEAVAAAEAELAEAERALAAQGETCARLQAGRARAAEALAAARQESAQADAEAARIGAEAEGLRAAMGDAPDEGILSAMQVPAGLEAALGAALGDACDASLDEGAAKFFRVLPGLVPHAVPPGADILADHVQAPPALARILGAMILLESPAAAEAAQPGLAPGMAAITRDGGCWRWDGQVTRPGAPNAAAVRLHQRNRLEMVLAAGDAAAAAAEAARGLCTAAMVDEAASQQFETAARAAHGRAETRLRAARETAASLAARVAQSDLQRATLEPAMRRLAGEYLAATHALEEAERALHDLAPTGSSEAALAAAAQDEREAVAALEAARIARAAARSRLAEAKSFAAEQRERAREIEGRIAGQQAVLARGEADLEDAAEAVAASRAAHADVPELEGQRAAQRAAEAAEAAATEAVLQARADRDAAEQALEAARALAARLGAEAVQAQSRLAALETVRARSLHDLEQAEQGFVAAEAALAALPDVAGLTEQAAAAQVALDSARKTFLAADGRLHALEAQALQAETGHALAVHDLAAWRARLDEAEARAENFLARRDAAREAHRSLADGPGALAARAERSAASLVAAEAAHAAALGRFQAAEQRVRALALVRRDAELQTAARREAFLRADSACEGAAGALAAVLSRAAERLGAEARIPETDEVSDEAEEKARQKFERLGRERDEMGPVNLRAEIELEELDQRLATLEQEREELATAIAKLRGSIGNLNREGRARLEAVFAAVDGHFRALFTRMMGGGRAHLALTGSEDPLMAGLEIFAEPPGKKLAALSLLSGGEQALTALSLIFAVFRCTPAPISVLDEVDAPLDDANVERFCTLLDDVVRETGTRFLVVTHHQLTMSRMDRLFGVTMQERGISRLLSVDFLHATAMVEPRLEAAE